MSEFSKRPETRDLMARRQQVVSELAEKQKVLTGMLAVEKGDPELGSTDDVSKAQELTADIRLLQAEKNGLDKALGIEEN
jgi:hypothetical protein